MQANDQRHDLRQEILARYASIHAFCRQHPELKRATVYAVLSGRYPGKIDTHITRIAAVLMGKIPPQPVFQSITESELSESLQNIRCNHCRRLARRNCPECRAQTEREARDLHSSLFCRRQDVEVVN